MILRVSLGPPGSLSPICYASSCGSQPWGFSARRWSCALHNILVSEPRGSSIPQRSRSSSEEEESKQAAELRMLEDDEQTNNNGDQMSRKMWSRRVLEEAKSGEVKMHEPSHVGRSNGWTDRLKRSAGAKFKLMVTEEDMFLYAILCI